MSIQNIWQFIVWPVKCRRLLSREIVSTVRMLVNLLREWLLSSSGQKKYIFSDLYSFCSRARPGFSLEGSPDGRGRAWWIFKWAVLIWGLRRRKKTSQIRQNHAKNDLQRFGLGVILFREFLFFSTLGWNYNSSQNSPHPESSLDFNINQTAQSAPNHAHDEVVLWLEFGGLTWRIIILV